MNKQTPKLIADLFIKKCLADGIPPYEHSRKASFGDYALTNKVRHIIKRWDDRRLYMDSMPQSARERLSDFVSELPVVMGVAIHRTEIGKPARIGCRAYSLETCEVLFEIRDQDIPEKYQLSNETKMRYAAFWAVSGLDLAA